MHGVVCVWWSARAVAGWRGVADWRCDDSMQRDHRFGRAISGHASETTGDINLYRFRTLNLIRDQQWIG